eukprot:jgi/Psemu1/307057/fgenesh1_kg.300_\
MQTTFGRNCQGILLKCAVEKKCCSSQSQIRRLPRPQQTKFREKLISNDIQEAI